MFTVIGIMFAGIAAGYLLRKIELLQKIGKPISYTILLLLFLLGISVGANKDIAGWGVYCLFFKERSCG